MQQPGNLICTVGTSLFFPNLNRLDPEIQYQKPPRPGDSQAEADWRALKGKGLLADPSALKRLMICIYEAHKAGDHARVAALFTSLPPDLRLLGAEINSVEAMVRKGFLSQDRARLILLVSDTDDGSAIGKILETYFLHPDCSVGFQQCSVETVKGLQDEKPRFFQREGLPNLVRLLGDHFRKWGGAIAINATGGYKAQIALAVAFGQASGSPVYYKHERFDQIIRFPQVPFTLDLTMVRDNLKLWADLAEPGASFERDAILRRLLDDRLREAFLPLLEWIEDDSGSLCSLSALGMVYWEAFRSLNPDAVLEPVETERRMGFHFRDDHYPKGFKEHVEKFYEAFPRFVSKCHSLPYGGQQSIKERFHIRDKRIVGEYLGRNRFGARFQVLTSAQNELERKFLLDLFNQWLKQVP